MTLHNNLSINYQNINCEGASTWTVIKRHGDFDNNQNRPIAIKDTSPTFKFVKAMPLRIVLVLDKSGSMRGNKLQQLLQAATNAILQPGQVDGRIGQLLI